MELSYNAVKKMDVVNVSDGKHLGRISDAVFFFPESRIQGFYVTGGKGFRFSKQDIFLPVSAIVRVGEDVILTDLHRAEPHKGRRAQGGALTDGTGCRRDYGEYE